ncbi:MAG: tetratricopeptide repeat protein [Lentisphaeria bacterium]|nr:tetratricopeptide repeat protein [Lentisphaeria bacterium]
MAKKKILISLGAVALLVTNSLAFSQEQETTAQSEFAWEMKLSDRLIEFRSIDLKDLAIVQLKRMKAKYPKNSDLINLNLAKCLQLSRQYKSFDKTIALIPANSKHQDAVTILKATQFTLLGKSDLAIAQYKVYFTSNPDVPADTLKLSQWSAAATGYSAILNKTGKKEDAALAVAMMAKIAEASKKSGNRSGFRVNVLKQCRLQVAAIQAGSVKDAKEKTAKLLELTKKLQKNAFSNDFIAMDSYFEIAKIKLINKDYKGVVKLMKQIGYLMIQLEAALKDGGNDLKFSPIPGGFYFYGEAYRSLAEQLLVKGKTANATKAFTLAIKKFSQAIEMYPQSIYATNALASLSKIGSKLTVITLPEEILEKYGKYLSGAGVPATVSFNNAMNLYSAGSYDLAIAGYKAALSSSLTDDTTPKALYYLIQAFLKTDKMDFSNTGKCWEIEAIADILTTDFASSDEAANICATLGSRYASKSKAAKKDKETSKKLLDTSMYWYDEFVNLRPRDEKAATYKFSIAENIRGKAITFERLIAATKDEVEKSRLRHEQQKVLYLAIPRYEALVKAYGESKFGKEANKSLGNVYYMLKKYDESAKLYLDYAAKQTDPKEKAAVYRLACMAYMKSETPAKAVPVFDKLISTIESNKLTGADSDKLLLDAYSLKAWAFDLASDKGSNLLKALKKDVYENKKTISKNKQLVRKNKKDLATTKELELAKLSEFKELIIYIESALPQSNKTSKETALSGKTAEERQKQAEQKKAKDKRLATAGLKQRKNRILGENVQLRTSEVELKALVKKYNLLLNTSSQALSKLKFATKGNQSKIKVIDFDIAQLLQKQKRTTKKLKQTEEILVDLEAKNKANRDLLKSPIEKERLAAKIAQLDLSRNTKKARKSFAVAFSEKQNADIMKELNTRTLTETKIGLNESTKLNVIAISAAEMELALVKAQLASAVSNLKTIKFGLAKNKIEKKYFGKESKANKTEIETKTVEYLKLTKNSQELETQAITLEAKLFMSRMDLLKKSNLALETQNVTIAKEMETVIVELAKVKRSTLKALEGYFAKYKSKNSHRALNLAKAGSTLIYFKEFEKAAKYLNDLKKDYPGHKLVESTTYSLANAYLEIGKYTDAQKIFSEKLKKKGSLTVVQVFRIQNTTFELAENSKGADLKVLLSISNQAGLKYQSLTLRDKTKRARRELSLFMLGKGAYLNKDYTKAISNFSRILDKNPKTGLIFELKLMQGICYRDQPQTDLKSAERSFYDIIQYGEDKIGSRIFFKAQLELAETKSAQKTRNGANTAANLLDVVAYGIDPENSEMFDLYEEVLYNAVQYSALSGNQKKITQHTKTYLDLFPKGKYAQSIKKLPRALPSKKSKTNLKK